MAPRTTRRGQAPGPAETPVPGAAPKAGAARVRGAAPVASTALAPDAVTERVAQDGVAMERLAQAVLPALVARFEASGLGELEVRRGEWRVRLRKPIGAAAAGGNPASTEAAGSLTPAARSTTSAKGAPSSRPTDGAARAAMAAVGPGRHAVLTAAPGSASRQLARSPAVGYFAPLEATVRGRAVRAGDVLGHIEVLGVRQEVVAPADGVVARVLAETGQAVEYGQELVRLEVPAADVPAVSEG